MASRQTKKNVFYGVAEVLTELERESDTEHLVESDSNDSYAFLEGEDPVLDKSDSGSDELWEPPVQTKKHRHSFTPSPSPTGSIHIHPTLPAIQGTSCTHPTASSHELLGPSTTLALLKQAAVAKKRARGRSYSTSGLQVGASSQVLGQEQEDTWHDITDDDEEPLLPRFQPKRVPGQQLLSTMTYSPLQLFQLFFSTSVVQTLVNNTNKFAEMSAAAGKKLKWTSVSVSEFYAFISLIIYMGLVKTKTIVDYWSQKQPYRLQYPCSVMSSKRFFAISSSLHISDPKEDAENMKKKGTAEYDKLFKIKPLYMDILSACKNFFHPRRELSIDERMVASKARSGLKQYMKGKPTKWGYKLFVFLLIQQLGTLGISLCMRERLPWHLEKDLVTTRSKHCLIIPY
ncbi:uncharacterized protein LOC143476823 [Brachyhypopomus gauderio]|uniref:uncharacterized protein LOC143476823 n=1 Tax=Brachyhypopomus gauderio TaxID=698409 RepID=UPI0040412D41